MSTSEIDICVTESHRLPATLPETEGLVGILGVLQRAQGPQARRAPQMLFYGLKGRSERVWGGQGIVSSHKTWEAQTFQKEERNIILQLFV